MLRISRLTDYAFILLSSLSEAEDQVVSCSAIAETAPLPLPTVRKVAKQLANAELLISHQGAHGGYELAQDLTQVTAADVIRAMEGPIAVTLCTEEGTTCEIEDACPTSQSWKIINAALQTALEGLTLADMQRPMNPQTVLANATSTADGESRRNTTP